jgi:hypothetical protein
VAPPRSAADWRPDRRDDAPAQDPACGCVRVATAAGIEQQQGRGRAAGAGPPGTPRMVPPPSRALLVHVWSAQRAARCALGVVLAGVLAHGAVDNSLLPAAAPGAARGLHQRVHPPGDLQ